MDYETTQHDDPAKQSTVGSGPHSDRAALTPPTDRGGYWQSLEEYSQTPEWQEQFGREFVSSPLTSEDGKSGWARREFLKLMGASMALGTFGCIRRPAQKIVPYVKRPPEIVNGIANHYASALIDGGEVLSTLVTTREGRPIKIEGNSFGETNQGAMSARGHAHILGLYDPDRINDPVRNLLNSERSNRDSVSVTWEQIETEVAEALKAKKTALLTGEVQSPATRNLLSLFCEATNARHYIWSPLSREVVELAHEVTHGEALSPQIQFDRAQIVVSLGCDFLGGDLGALQNTKRFAKARRPDSGTMTELVCFEPLMTLTGSNADSRFRVRASDLKTVALGLLSELVIGQKLGAEFASVRMGEKPLSQVLASYKSVDKELHLPAGSIKKLALKLKKAKGQSIILAGGLQAQTDDGLELQVLVNFLNRILENEGKTLVGATRYGDTSRTKNLLNWIEACESGQVDLAIIHDTNPLYASALSERIRRALSKVKLVVYTGDRVNETGQVANLVAPDHHSLENWGDAQEWQGGSICIQQPTIQPLRNTKAFQDLLLGALNLAGMARGSLADTNWYDYLKSYWTRNFTPTESAWVNALQEGGVSRTSTAKSYPSFRSSSLSQINVGKKAQGQVELVLYSTVGLAGGELANIGWLQEFPDPVSKICWDNYVTVSVGFAQKEKVKEGQLIELVVGDIVVKAPVHISPGQHDDVFGLAVGYGRWAAGSVGNRVGVNAFALTSMRNGVGVYAGLALEWKLLAESSELANVQGHHSMEGRQIVVEAKMADFLKNPSAGIHKHESIYRDGKVLSLWGEHSYPGHKWGMAIDLSTCTGCGACMIACQSENNIPVVGKKFVLQGREMHWIRVDRYYTGDPNDPGVVHQPLTCQHCDNAPCETVCPVAATVHGDEGTNDMIYNRCVGTRYCANNCPYKVRRFNWFDYIQTQKNPLHMALNPEVTVRHRGVMEKCTFCTHRIKDKKNELAYQGRAWEDLKDGEVVTACQQSCPTQAIVFGDLNDAGSRVSQLFKNQRSYALLEEWHARPVIRYQTKVRVTDHIKGQVEHGPGHGKGEHHSSLDQRNGAEVEA